MVSGGLDNFYGFFFKVMLYERLTPERKAHTLAESVYKVIALVGTSNDS